jgi:hypothetical protein
MAFFKVFKVMRGVGSDVTLTFTAQRLSPSFIKPPGSISLAWCKTERKMTLR